MVAALIRGSIRNGQPARQPERPKIIPLISSRKRTSHRLTT
jgi:hypothetical protein